jgi:hypothetical protein
MLAYVNDAVFVQIWIGADDKLPRMLRAVYRDDPLRLRHQMELANWKLDPVVAARCLRHDEDGYGGGDAFAHPDAKARLVCNAAERKPTKAQSTKSQ